MSTTPNRLVIAVSSRALFDLSENNSPLANQGTHAHQQTHEQEVLKPGVAFALTRKLLALNTPEHRYVDIILLSRNSADTGMRVFNAINHYHLDIARAAFTRGAPPSRYVAAFGAQLFLSNDIEDVQRTLADGCAAATILPGAGLSGSEEDTKQFRIAFDGDIPLFLGTQHDTAEPHAPQSGGAFRPFLRALQRIQMAFPEDQVPLRTALVTERPKPAHENVAQTLKEWNIRVDEAFFLGELDKSEFLLMFGADIFLDGLTVSHQALHTPSAQVTRPLVQSAPQFTPAATASTPIQHSQEVVHRLEEATLLNTSTDRSQLSNNSEHKELSFIETHPSHSTPLEHIAAQTNPLPSSAHFTPIQTVTPVSSFEDPFVLSQAPLQQEQPLHYPTHLSELSLLPAHMDSDPIIDGAHPKPTITAPASHSKTPPTEEVWLFDEQNTPPANQTPIPLPTTPANPFAIDHSVEHRAFADIPTSAISTQTEHPTQTDQLLVNPIKSTEKTPQKPESSPLPQPVTHTEKIAPEEHILSTEEILKRFARKMTEGNQKSSPPTAPSAASSQTTSAIKPTPPSASTTASPQKADRLALSEDDLLQGMMVQETDDPLMLVPTASSQKPQTPQHAVIPNPFAEDPLLQPRSASPFSTKTHPATSTPQPSTPGAASQNTAPKPAAPNPFAIMTNFDEK